MCSHAHRIISICLTTDKSTLFLVVLQETLEPASDDFCRLPPPDLCVCSPRIYRVAWDTSWENCKNNNIVGLPGIAAASPFCKYNADMKEVYKVTFKEYNIYGIEFKTTEFDMNDYIQPGQDYVRNGYIDYVSVSNELDPSVPLEDQLDRVPRSIKVEVLGYAHFDFVHERYINYSQIIYTNECGTGPINFPNGVNVPDNEFQTTGRLGIFGFVSIMMSIYYYCVSTTLSMCSHMLTTFYVWIR